MNKRYHEIFKRLVSSPGVHRPVFTKRRRPECPEVPRRNQEEGRGVSEELKSRGKEANYPVPSNRVISSLEGKFVIIL